MAIIGIGLSHRTAPVTLREKLAFDREGVKEANRDLAAEEAFHGCVIVATCNRTEVYVDTTRQDDARDVVAAYLARRAGVARRFLSNHLYVLGSFEAARHLFRVASGLDSMVLGEPQVLGQLAEAYQVSLETETTNKPLNVLFQRAIAVGKRVRTETSIDRNPVSVSSTAVELARQIVGSLKDVRVVVVGAGDMAELVLLCLGADSPAEVVVTNRTFERARELAARFGGTAVPFDQRYEAIARADLVISGTSAPECVVYSRPLERARQSVATFRGSVTRPAAAAEPALATVIVDIALPRDVEPSCAHIPGVTVLNLDDIRAVVDRNLEQRRAEVPRCETIIEEEMDAFMRWHNSLTVIPIVRELVSRAESFSQAKAAEALDQMGKISEKQAQEVRDLARTVANGVLHDLIVNLKEYAATYQGELEVKTIARLFNLGGGQSRSGAQRSGLAGHPGEAGAAGHRGDVHQAATDGRQAGERR